jgi:pyrroloquinoline quinone biosynthesis protein B
LHPGPGPRDTPIRGVLLTDAELDHTIGLLTLREGSTLDVFATGAVLAALDRAFPVRAVTQRYSPRRWIAVTPQQRIEFAHGRLQVTPIGLGEKRPRYARGVEIDGNWVIGYRIVDTETGGAAVFAPCIPSWNCGLEAALQGAQCAFVDGTFWSDDEMERVGTGHLTASAMGHVPITGEQGSAARLAALHGCRAVYVHINNTNPVLDEQSAEFARLYAMGIEVGRDGMEVEL